jgi:hypothetical protein
MLCNYAVSGFLNVILEVFMLSDALLNVMLEVSLLNVVAPYRCNVV